MKLKLERCHSGDPEGAYNYEIKVYETYKSLG